MRSVWKGPFMEKLLPTQRIWSRRTILPIKVIGNRYRVYNGKKFVSVTIKSIMVGHKIGEFANTRRKSKHKKKIQNKKRK